MRQPISRWIRFLGLAALAAAAGGCIVTSTVPPYRPGMESLPKGNVAAREQIILNQLTIIKKAEAFYNADRGSYATLDELVSAGHLTQSPQGLGYTIDLTVTEDGTGYEVMAVPVEYGPDGRMSFYLDQSGVIRGADHQGGAPSAEDPQVKMN